MFLKNILRFSHTTINKFFLGLNLFSNLESELANETSLRNNFLYTDIQMVLEALDNLAHFLITKKDYR